MFHMNTARPIRCRLQTMVVAKRRLRNLTGTGWKAVCLRTRIGWTYHQWITRHHQRALGCPIPWIGRNGDATVSPNDQRGVGQFGAKQVRRGRSLQLQVEIQLDNESASLGGSPNPPPQDTPLSGVVDPFARYVSRNYSTNGSVALSVAGKHTVICCELCVMPRPRSFGC